MRARAKDVMLDHIKIIDDLKFEREWLGLSRRQVAERMGIPQGTLAGWEDGAIVPRLDKLICWAEALNFHVGLYRG
jgi:transcriptional regulator with XRE-family HTH domain